MPPYDIKRELKAVYAPRNTAWNLVDIPEQRFLAIDGHGDPNTAPAYARAVEALYSVAYTAKSACRRSGGRDFVVGPLEGLWWADDLTVFRSRDKDAWHWTMLISLPDWVTGDLVEEARDTAMAKKKLAAIAEVRHETRHEGRCAQVLHVGSYDAEAPLLAALHDDYLPAQRLRPTGHHHEIYLSDPRRIEAAKLRTILRQPVAPAD